MFERYTEKARRGIFFAGFQASQSGSPDPFRFVLIAVAGWMNQHTNSQETQSSGTYTVHDNVLMLVKNGKNEQHMIFPASGDNLNVDGRVYVKQK